VITQRIVSPRHFFSYPFCNWSKTLIPGVSRLTRPIVQHPFLPFSFPHDKHRCLYPPSEDLDRLRQRSSGGRSHLLEQESTFTDIFASSPPLCFVKSFPPPPYPLLLFALKSDRSFLAILSAFLNIQFKHRTPYIFRASQFAGSLYASPLMTLSPLLFVSPCPIHAPSFSRHTLWTPPSTFATFSRKPLTLLDGFFFSLDLCFVGGRRTL